MKFCYLDESGLGEEPYAVLAGVVVDAGRMAPTKHDWSALLQQLSERLDRPLSELHTKDFYPGNGVWRGLSGPERSQVIDDVFSWLGERKHHVVYSVVDRGRFFSDLPSDERLNSVGTDWRLMGLHVALAIQKKMQKEHRPKGQTVLVFDNHEVEQRHLTDLILNPPEWTDTYYGKSQKDERLNQIIDVPHFVDSRHVGLVQLADFLSFFLRKHIELQEGSREPDYEGEQEKLGEWVKQFSSRSLGKQYCYPTHNRCAAAELICGYAPQAALAI